MPIIFDSINNPDPNAFWPRLSTYSKCNKVISSHHGGRGMEFLERLKNVEIGYFILTNETGLFSGLNTRIYFTGLIFNFLNFGSIYGIRYEMGGNGLGYPPKGL